MLSALGLVTVNAATARAGSMLTVLGSEPMFTVTDLGSSYTLQQDSSGTVHTVTSGDGDQTFAFEKAPVTQINQRVNSDVIPGVLGTIYYLFQVGTNKYGFETYYNPALPNGSESVPLGIPLETGWHDGGMNGIISDVNAKGQFVGSGVSLSSGTFAAFSTPSGGSHSIGDLGGYYYADALNTFIASNLGVNLTSSLKIDDLGDIIAEGSLNGANQYFLLTLNGPPTPAPEPTAILTLGVGIVTLCIHRVRRRTKQPVRNDRQAVF
jgi:hypothetical protein